MNGWYIEWKGFSPAVDKVIVNAGHFNPEKVPAPIVQNAGWNSETVRTGTENNASTRNRFPGLPICSESLYVLRYSGSPSFDTLTYFGF